MKVYESKTKDGTKVTVSLEDYQGILSGGQPTRMYLIRLNDHGLARSESKEWAFGYAEALCER